VEIYVETVLFRNSKIEGFSLHEKGMGMKEKVLP
jgi:hypothetical protein